MKHQSVVLILLVTVIAVTASCRQPRLRSSDRTSRQQLASLPSHQRPSRTRPTATSRGYRSRLGENRIPSWRSSNLVIGMWRGPASRNDPGDYKLAEKTAECIESTSPDDASALLLRGHVLHQLHRFNEAEQIARRLTVKRQFVLDYGLLGDVLMEQGRLTEAADAYQKMIDIKPFYQSYTRASHLRWLKGDLGGAIELIAEGDCGGESARSRVDRLGVHASRWLRAATRAPCRRGARGRFRAVVPTRLRSRLADARPSVPRDEESRRRSSGAQPRGASSIRCPSINGPSATRYGFTAITNKRTWSKAS